MAFGILRSRQTSIGEIKDISQGYYATTYYVRDAGGNVLSVYEDNNTAASNGPLTQTELHLYGSSRLGVYNVSTNVETNNRVLVLMTGVTAGTGEVFTFARGQKFFELSNHLGNVLVTISDKKIGVDDGTYGEVCPPCAPQPPGVPSDCPCYLRQDSNTPDGITDYYTAEVVTANDYYPFGMQMPGRKYTSVSSGYRYGFNGKENDNEVKGEGNQQDYGMRIYDPRLGKFLSVDPISELYPWFSPYQFAGNTPVWAIDLDGLEPYAYAYKFASEGNPKLNLFHSDNVVNMSGSTSPTSWNSLGWQRDPKYFWNNYQNTPLRQGSIEQE